ncbi:Spermidine export protein mdtI [Klebsiella pneumoniae]|uniref:Spermidine export protein MdtI n=1 Tax=Klebsiella pneumoniae TaxID=573 RepID=A0A377WKK2_KLEPN|nr:Spermidine export protein mdtI [Klebsiella pneumoniae]
MDPRRLAGNRHCAGNYCQRLFEVFRRLRRKIYGILSLAAVLGAFSALSQAVKGIDLSVAYALWGGFGIAATIAAGWVLFGQRLNNKGWAGVILLVAGMVLIKLA